MFYLIKLSAYLDQFPLQHSLKKKTNKKKNFSRDYYNWKSILKLFFDEFYFLPEKKFGYGNKSSN